MASECTNCGSRGGPKEAMKGPREELMHVICTYGEKGSKGDYLATVDVDPQSSTYCQVIHREHMPHIGDELHHMGWNACVSCPGVQRQYLLLMALHGNRVYAIDAASNPRSPRLAKVVESHELLGRNVSFPHTSHCVSTGEVLISTLGDADGNAKGDFLVLDSVTLEVKGVQSSLFPQAAPLPFGYDFWYKPRHNVLVSSSWGPPRTIRGGFDPSLAGCYGNSLFVLDWRSRQLLQQLDLGDDGKMLLEVRFLHDPLASVGYVASALGSCLFRFHKQADGTWNAHKVAQISAKKVENWCLPAMPAIISDFLISLDDRFLYLSCWLHGEIRQYDISDTANPKLLATLSIAGLLSKDSGVRVPDWQQPEPLVIKGRHVDGGPQMLQLSLDGRRLYVTTSLYSVWDKQFYPQMVKNGSVMLQVNVDVEQGGLAVNEDFLVDFGAEPDGPALAHQMRYPGGDCTSDIWV